MDIKDWLVVSKIFYFHPYLGKISNLTNIFQRGWNHQLEEYDTMIPLYFDTPVEVCNVMWCSVI